MRYLTIILLLILSGCSAQWHLQRALEKDRTIIDTKADTFIRVDTTLFDTTITYEKTFDLKIISDTIRIEESTDTTIDNTYHSKDSIAHARVKYRDEMINAWVWATKDTSLVHKDSVRILLTKVDSFQTIVKQKQAEIKELRTLRQKIKDIGTIIVWALGGILLLIVFLKILKIV